MRSASANGDLNEAMRLVADGEGVSELDEGFQAIRDAANGGHLEMLQWLVSQGAAVDACSNNGVQAIHTASAIGHIEVVQWLVSQGAAVDASTNTGKQPLHSASYCGHLEVVQWLVSQGAAVDVCSNDGISHSTLPLPLAISR